MIIILLKNYFLNTSSSSFIVWTPFTCSLLPCTDSNRLYLSHSPFTSFTKSVTSFTAHSASSLVTDRIFKLLVRRYKCLTAYVLCGHNIQTLPSCVAKYKVIIIDILYNHPANCLNL